MMNKLIKEEQEVNIKHFIIECFKQWRLLAIAVIAGVFLMAGFCALKKPNMISIDQNVIKANQQQIDKNNTNISEHQKTINSNNQQIKSNNNTIKVRENEIIAATEKLDEQKKYLTNYESLLKEANRLKATVNADTRAELIAQISELMKIIPEKKAEIEATEATIAGYTNEINSMKYAIEKSLPESNKNLEEKITALQQQNEELKAGMEPYAEEKGVGDFIKFAVIGAFLGVFSIGCWILVRHTFSKKIRTADSIKDHYNFPVIADLHVAEKKYNTRIDLMIEKWNNEKREINMEEEHELLASVLCAVCPDDRKEILFISSVDFAYMESLCKEIKKYLKRDIEITVVGNPVSDADAAWAIKDACVVLVEKTGESEYADINQITERISLSNAKLLGCVLV